MNSCEKILIYCIGCLVIVFIYILICCIPNGPKIIINKPNRPSCAKAESIIPSPPIRRSLGIFLVSAYCPGECCCGDYADGITASGWKINIGDKFCAADPMIPFLKVLDIEGYGAVPVLDRGGKIKGNKLDVFFWTHEEALEWGVQEIEIFCWVQGE